MLHTAAALRVLLVTDIGVSTLVGTHIFDGAINQARDYHAASAFRKDDEFPLVMLTERSSGLEDAVYRFFSTAKGSDGYLTAKAVHHAVFMRLQGYRGIVADNSSPIQTLEIHRIAIVSSFDFFDEMSKTHQVVSDYAVSAEQERPT